MKINTAKLKALVEEALRQDRVAWDQEEEDFTSRQAAHLKKWHRDYDNAWLESANKIINALDEGKPVTPDLLPHTDGARTKPYYLSDVALYTPPSPKSRHEKDIVSGKAEYHAPQSLLKFRAVLDLIEDDTLTTSALRDHGLANLDQRLMQYITMSVER